MGVILSGYVAHVECNTCHNRTEDVRIEPNGQHRARDVAEQQGWHINYTNGEAECPSCQKKQKSEHSLLRTLDACHERMQRAAIQEVKDNLLCQLVLSLFPYVPSQEARGKIAEILQGYNSEERIPE